MSRNSYVLINPGQPLAFEVDDLFSMVEKDAVEIGFDVRAFQPPDLHPYVQGMKEAWTLAIPKLTQAQYNALKRVLFQTGAGVLFTVVYSTSQLVRRWDGATAPGYGVNTDINRVRNKMRLRKLAAPHWPGQASFYSASIDFEEA